MAKAQVNKETGLVSEHKLNEVIYHTKVRPNGTIRIQQDFSYCPTKTEQHTAHETDINYLMKKFRPDELAAYLAARETYRQEILGHDFASEPSLQDAKNTAYELKQAYNNLPDELKNQFKDHVQFLKFIDNPANQEKMIKLGLLTKTEIAKVTDIVTPTKVSEEKTETKAETKTK